MSLRREYSFLPERQLIEESRIIAKNLNLLDELEALLIIILKISFNKVAMIYLGSSTEDVPVKDSNGLRFYDEFHRITKDRRVDDKQILKILERRS